MIKGLLIRDARPEDAPFLAECIMAGMHFHDFGEDMSGGMSDILEGLTGCEGREDTLYSWARTRVAEVNGKPAGALLSYPGELYPGLRDKTFREYWPAFFTEHADDDLETGPGEYYLDSLAVIPAYRRRGIGRALLEDGIRKGVSLGFRRVSLVVDADYGHLISLYESICFVPDGHRHAFGTDFLRMVFMTS